MGDIEFTKDMGTFRPGERVGVRLKTQQFNIHNEETLDLTKEIKLAKLKRYPRGFLKRKHALRFFIQDSHILRVDPTLHTFCHFDRRHWGLLEPVIDNPEAYTPLLIFLSQNPQGDPILAAFCM